MKTVRQWFETLPEPYRTQAIENSLPGNLLATVSSLQMAFSCGFTFRHSKEGLNYWRAYFELVKENKHLETI
jgi:hypothetical protein